MYHYLLNQIEKSGFQIYDNFQQTFYIFNQNMFDFKNTKDTNT